MNGHSSGTAALLAILPTLQRQAHFAFCGIKDPGHFDDVVQETLAICWLWCCRLAERGKDARQFPTRLAAYAVRHVRGGRTFVGKKRLTRDVLAPLAQTIHGFLTQALSSVEAQACFSWQAALEDNRQSPPDEQAAFRIDFPAFLATLSERDRQVAEAMLLGSTTQELAGRHAVSPARISQLRRKLRDDWLAFTSDRT